ncbi:ER degradation-enhancing alpha-mannosidase 3 [Pelomyxa schiedti]|nr:ER degradation-enhancing alpha-mannosidase 3 [Pelomyxa schiedti]
MTGHGNGKNDAAVLRCRNKIASPAVVAAPYSFLLFTLLFTCFLPGRARAIETDAEVQFDLGSALVEEEGGLERAVGDWLWDGQKCAGDAECYYLPFRNLTENSRERRLGELFDAPSLGSLRERVRSLYIHGWDSYMLHAFPADELCPLACIGRTEKTRGTLDDILGRYSLTLIDGMDTLAVMGNWSEYYRALNLVSTTVSFDNDVVVSVFEATIRVLGGLLSNHAQATLHSSEFPEPHKNEFLILANDLGTRLLPAFNTTTGIPYPKVNLHTGIPYGNSENTAETVTTTAEAGTLLLEFGLLSALTDNPTFRAVADKSLSAMWTRRSKLDLLGTTINIFSGKWGDVTSSIGPGMDSFYEYLIKCYIAFGDYKYLDMFWTAYDAVNTFLRKGALYYSVHMASGSVVSDVFTNMQMFWPALQVLVGHLHQAEEMHHFHSAVTAHHGFPPERFTVRNNELFLVDPGYTLRPEFIESAFTLFEATGDPSLILSAKALLEHFEKTARVPCGFASLADMRSKRHDDRLDSYFFSETLKYLYMLFDSAYSSVCNESVLCAATLFPHNLYVFSTQAHPFPLSAFHVGNSSSKLSSRTISHDPLFHFSCPAFQLAAGQLSGKQIGNPQPVEPLTLRLWASTGTHNLSVNAASATFGQDLRNTTYSSLLSISQPIDACRLPISFSKSAAIVQRGGCSFVEKALNVQQSGATALIVYDQVDSPELFTMTSAVDMNSARVEIPAVLISLKDGKLLTTLLTQGDVWVKFENKRGDSQQPFALLEFISHLLGTPQGSIP